MPKVIKSRNQTKEKTMKHIKKSHNRTILILWCRRGVGERADDIEHDKTTLRL